LRAAWKGWADVAETDDPIDRIKWVEAATLHSNPWNPNRVHRRELALLEHSLLSTGWIQPVLVSRDGLVIDGFHRWRLSQDSPKVRAVYGGRVPVAVLDVDRPQAMLMTVRINRAKGTHVALDMSAIVRELLEVHHYRREDISREMGASLQEVDLLAQESVFKAKGIPDHRYSKAWYPQDDGKTAEQRGYFDAPPVDAKAARLGPGR
jgi:ParB-like chromosome segregation protein Spo0J